MVVKIHMSAASTKGPLDYNERKVAMGEAEVVGVSGMKNDSLATIYRTFEEYERNPAISAKTRSLAFHMTVNPGPGERRDTATTMSYISELMDRLGYGDQPYVVYRHNDIDREHFHVVSVRVDRTGKVIGDSFMRRNLQSIMKDINPRYGYVTGKGNEPSREDRKARLADRKRVGGIVRSCFSHSTSEFHFTRMLERKDIGTRIFRTAEGRIYGALFEDRKSGFTFKCSELGGISVGMMRDALDSGKWAESRDIHHRSHEEEPGTKVGHSEEKESVLNLAKAAECLDSNDKSRERDKRARKRRRGPHI